MIKHKIKRFKQAISNIFCIIRKCITSDAYIFIHHKANTNKSGAIYSLPYYIEYHKETAGVFLLNFEKIIDDNEPENVKQRFYAQKIKMN